MSPAKFQDDFGHQRSRNMIREINGPRPSPLKITNDSHVIRKLSSSSNSSLLAHHNNKQQQQQQQQRKQPVIIYDHSPKVIHTQARDFMALVQKLTGLSRSGGHGDDHYHETNKQTMKQKQKTSGDHDHDNDSSSSISPITKSPSNPFLADMPLFTPTSTDIFCSPRPMFRFPEITLAPPISLSLTEFMKALPEC